MREIKFRAWDKELKKFLYGIQDLGWFLSNLQTWEITQFTSLLDRNGNEIYENDILGGIEEDPESKFTIKFQDGAFGYDIIGGEFIKHRNLSRFIKQFEVIGNIYENPELLK